MNKLGRVNTILNILEQISQELFIQFQILWVSPEKIKDQEIWQGEHRVAH